MCAPSASQFTPATLLVAGFGKLGTRLGEHYIARGTDVLGVRRSESEARGGVELIRTDLADPDAPRFVVPRVDALVITLPPPAVDGVVAPNAYRCALEKLATSLPAVLARAVFVSSTRVFDGSPVGSEPSEEDAPAPATDRARALLDGERCAAELFGARVIRASGIYGPG